MDIESKHREGEITVFVNSATPEVQLTTRREEAKATVNENDKSIITVAENIEAVKDAAKYVDTFDDIIQTLPQIMQATTAADRAEKAQASATEAKDTAVASASLASVSATGATESAQKAEESEKKALASEQSAQNSANSASESKTSAQNSALLAAESATSARQDLDSIKADAEMVAEYAPKAIQAAESAEIAKASAISAAERAEQASQGVEGALANKQDKLTAGEGITIEGNVISSTSSVPENVYTQDNLIAGKNVTFSEVPPEGGIDENTLACWHFDDNLLDEVSGLKFSVGSMQTSYKKFGNGGLINDTSGAITISSIPYSSNNDISFDCWCVHFPAAGVSKIGLVDGSDPFMYFYASGSTLTARIRGTSVDGEIEFSDGAWHHLYAHYIAKENKYEMFVDGKRIASKIVEKTFAEKSDFVFGRVIDEIRISDCVRWTEDFTPPAEPYKVAEGHSKTAVNASVAVPTKTSELENDSGFLTGLPDGVFSKDTLLGGKDIEIVPEPVDGGIDSHTKALWHFDGDVIDSVGGNSLSGTLNSKYKKFGDGSFQATYAKNLTSAYYGESLTIDCWIMLASEGQIWIGPAASSTSNYYLEGWIFRLSNSKIQFGKYIKSGSSWTLVSEADAPYSIGEWFHVAIQKTTPTFFEIFINGKKILEGVSSDNTEGYATSIVDRKNTSYIDELRVSDIARYAEAFTPPTEPYRLAEPTGNYQINYTGKEGGNGKNIGEVYYSQSSLATDNSGALPLFTGESIASANTIYPEFYAWVESHTELQTTAEEYETALTTYGECPKYVISNGTLRLPKLSNYVKMANTSEGITQTEAGLPNITGTFGGIRRTDVDMFSGAFTTLNDGYNGIDYSSGASWITRNDIDASRSSEVYGKSETVTPAHTTLYPWVYAYNSAIPASTAQAAEFQQGLSGKADSNLANVTEDGQKTAVSWIMPDYSRSITTGLTGKPTSATTTSYTCPTDGWLQFYATRGDMDGNTLYLVRNGETHFYFPAYVKSFASLMFPVSKSDVISLKTDATSGTWDVRTCLFIPCKGV